VRGCALQNGRPTACYISSQNDGRGGAYAENGQVMELLPEECEQKNREARTAAAQAEEQARQRANQQAQIEQQRRAAAAAQVVRDDEARGYKHVTLKDLLLDGKTYAAGGTKLVISGFYKMHGRHDERLYESYDDFMIHSLNNLETSYVALLTEAGSRSMREYLMRCAAGIGCSVTILGHVSSCVEINIFGAKTGDFCFVAEDMRS
jgi:hypothetical protein